MRRFALLSVLVLAVTAAFAADPPAVDPKLFDSLEWRDVGPYRGGRAAAVEGIAGDPLTYYFGATGGGVWKTTDGGRTWVPVSDGFFGGSIGAIDAADSDPNIIYVGTGEKTVRGNVSHGDNHDLWIAPGDPLRMIEANDGGANVSFDGGASWTGQDN
ncbi:MAG: glycosyl hydrolase, partial [Acidobacteria bacterium]|nr:glycosyl hydrolase [Acidobacteriota bacterium]